jgi:hypothetical protein
MAEGDNIRRGLLDDHIPADLEQAQDGRHTAADEFTSAAESAFQAGIRTPENRVRMSDPWRIPGL